MAQVNLIAQIVTGILLFVFFLIGLLDTETQKHMEAQNIYCDS